MKTVIGIKIAPPETNLFNLQTTQRDHLKVITCFVFKSKAPLLFISIRDYRSNELLRKQVLPPILIGE